VIRIHLTGYCIGTTSSNSTQGNKCSDDNGGDNTSCQSSNQCSQTIEAVQRGVVTTRLLIRTSGIERTEGKSTIIVSGTNDRALEALVGNNRLGITITEITNIGQIGRAAPIHMDTETSNGIARIISTSITVITSESREIKASSSITDIKSTSVVVTAVHWSVLANTQERSIEANIIGTRIGVITLGIVGTFRNTWRELTENSMISIGTITRVGQGQITELWWWTSEVGRTSGESGIANSLGNTFVNTDGSPARIGLVADGVVIITGALTTVAIGITVSVHARNGGAIERNG